MSVPEYVLDWTRRTLAERHYNVRGGAELDMEGKRIQGWLDAQPAAPVLEGVPVGIRLTLSECVENFIEDIIAHYQNTWDVDEDTALNLLEDDVALRALWEAQDWLDSHRSASDEETA